MYRLSSWKYSYVKMNLWLTAGWTATNEKQLSANLCVGTQVSTVIILPVLCVRPCGDSRKYLIILGLDDVIAELNCM